MCNRQSGQCRCAREIIGRTCDTCAMEGYYGPINRRCRMCNCHPNNTEECVKVSGLMQSNETSCNNVISVIEDWPV